MGKLVKIGEAARLLGVSIGTLRAWERQGKIVPEPHKKGETRFYNTQKLLMLNQSETDLTFAYARVSSHDQKKDLITQAELLGAYCATHGWRYEVIEDLGSGMNYRKKGLKKLLNAIINREIKRLVITHKDRLLRFGAEIVFTLCESRNIEVVIINHPPTRFLSASARQEESRPPLKKNSQKTF